MSWVMESIVYIGLIKLMSSEKYIEEVLEMPSNQPLFKYNVNFNNLRRLIEDVNVQTNSVQDRLTKV